MPTDLERTLTVTAPTICNIVIGPTEIALNNQKTTDVQLTTTTDTTTVAAIIDLDPDLDLDLETVVRNMIITLPALEENDNKATTHEMIDVDHLLLTTHGTTIIIAHQITMHKPQPRPKLSMQKRTESELLNMKPLINTTTKTSIKTTNLYVKTD